jgi:hypothetical protein
MINFSVRKLKIRITKSIVTMASGINSLHKILKDENRRRIILQLQEKGSITYVDLMKILGITNTGKMNYHLKVLGDLIGKNEDGKYVLTEKGKLATRLLLEFNERTSLDKKSPFQIESEFPKWYLTLIYVSATVYLVVFLALYAAGIIDFSRLLLTSIIIALGIAFFFVAQKMRQKSGKWSPRRQMLGIEIGKIIFGALVGMVVFIFGGALILLGFQALLKSLGIQFKLPPFAISYVIISVAGAIVGGYIAYWRYRRSKYSRVSYFETFP